MKGIYLIFTAACLVEQLKANVYSVKITDVTGTNPYDVWVSLDFDTDPRVVIYKTLNEANIQMGVYFMDSMEEETGEIEEPCNMDPSTEEGTVAAIFWRGFGIESCPIEPGNYTITREFNQTGILEKLSVATSEGISIYFSLSFQDGKGLFQTDAVVRLVEEETP